MCIRDSPSYRPYGATSFDWATAIIASGMGANTVGHAPSFSVTTGVTKLQILSDAASPGTYRERAWAGVQDVYFDCSGSCASGSYTVNVTWNVTWKAIINTTCPATMPATAFAWANVSVKSDVIDLAGGAPSLAGSGILYLFTGTLTSPGAVTAGHKGQTVTLSFPASLTAGNSYELEAWFAVNTLANAAAPSGGSCTSSSLAETGLVAKTILESIVVS